MPALYATLEDLVLASMGRPVRPGVLLDQGPIVEAILATMRESRA